MTRVLHVAQPTSAGVAAVVRLLAADQAARGYDVHVACPAEGPLAGEVAAAGATHHTWHATRSPGPKTLAETRALAGIVRATRPDVVHLHSSKAGLAGRLAVRGRVPTVFAPHAWSFLAATGAQRRAALGWERRAARWAHALLAVSEAERAEGERAGIAARYEVVPNGVDLAHHAVAGDPGAARAALGLDGPPLAVCVGRLSEQKGQDLLVAAWQAAWPEAGPGGPPPGRLVLVGDGPLEHRLRAATATAATATATTEATAATATAAATATTAAAGVLLAGAVADPRPWYAAADVVVVPSRWEGMALVPLEAMAAGRAVVAFDVAGVRESVPPEAGAVVPAGDAAALVAEVARRLADPERAAREGRAGRAHVERHHDASVTAARTRAVYAALLAQ